MATKPQAAFDRLAAANNNTYNASTNPGGLANGGHRQNFVLDLKAVADIGLYAGAVADELSGSVASAAQSAQTATDKAAAAAQSAANAAQFDPATYAPKASPAFTGNPTAPTPATTDNDTSISTTAFVKAALADALAAYMAKAGGRWTGAVSSAVKAHGSKGSVTEAFAYSDGNTHSVTCAGNLVINPTGLSEGDVMQVNLLYSSGSVSVSGTTYWELGGGEKSTTLADLGITLTAGRPYRIIFEMVGGLRMGVFQ